MQLPAPADRFLQRDVMWAVLLAALVLPVISSPLALVGMIRARRAGNRAGIVIFGAAFAIAVLWLMLAFFAQMLIDR